MDSAASPSVSHAINSRVSCRAFLPTPVPAALIRQILEAAKRAPSGGNLQPWHVHVLSGTSLSEFLGRIRTRLTTHPHGEGTEYDIYPKQITEPYIARRSQCGEDVYGAAGIPRDNRAARMQQFARNYELFGAPVAMFFAIDRQMGLGQWADLGMFMQNIMLLAREHGLHTCPQESWAVWHRTVANYLKLPAELMLFCGMALGYADPDAPINQVRTQRAALPEFATLHGLDGLE
jgi:nitroreductase